MRWLNAVRAAAAAPLINWPYANILETLALELPWIPAGTPDTDYVDLAQPSAPEPPPQEHRELKWGDLNFIHITDSHGWLAGHLLEPEFSADWGDIVSFSSHMKQLAADRGVDLLLVDTGDRHDGNGLCDASDPAGKYIPELFGAVDFDVITIGNHELYRGEVAIEEYLDFRDRFRERYVVSNVEVKVDNKWVDMGYKYRQFSTKTLGTRVLGFGFLFDFTGNDRSVTRVTRVEDEIKKPWFQALLENEIAGGGVDVILIPGHIPVRGSPEFPTLVEAIRSVNKTIPIVVFGGHSHIRDLKVYDDRAVGLESGRFMETVGWASIDMDNKYKSGDNARDIFGRTYIDSNREALAFHANRTLDGFTIESGQEVSDKIARIRKELDLDKVISCVPQTYYTDRRPFPHPESIFSLLQDHVLGLLESPGREDKSRFVLLNTGAIRFDLFKGLYTRDTGYIVSPFKNDWFYLPDVPADVAKNVIRLINREDKVVASHSRGERGGRFEGTGDAQNNDDETDLTYGYVTRDDFGKLGDDTPHKAWTFYPLPNAIVAERNVTDATAHVDLVFQSFMVKFVLKALSTLGYKDLGPQEHGGKQVIELLPEYLETLEWTCG